MKVYFVNFLVILACDVSLPAPMLTPVSVPQLPQPFDNYGTSPTGLFSTMFDLASLLPNSFLSKTQNVVHSIPIVNMLPAAIESGIQMGESIAEDMDCRLSKLEIGRSFPYTPQNFQPDQNYGPTGMQPGYWQPNFPYPPINDFKPVVHQAMPPVAAPPAFSPMPEYAAPPTPALSPFTPPPPPLPVTDLPAEPAPQAVPTNDGSYQVNGAANLFSTLPISEHFHQTIKTSKKAPAKAPKKAAKKDPKKGAGKH